MRNRPIASRNVQTHNDTTLIGDDNGFCHWRNQEDLTWVPQFSFIY